MPTLGPFLNSISLVVNRGQEVKSAIIHDFSELILVGGSREKLAVQP